MSGVLPQDFAALEPFVAEFAAQGSARRAALRDTTAFARQAEFFAAAAPLLDAALDYLDARDLRALAPAEQTLLDLMLVLPHVAQAVEVHGAASEAALTPWRQRMRIERASADT